MVRFGVELARLWRVVRVDRLDPVAVRAALERDARVVAWRVVLVEG